MATVLTVTANTLLDHVAESDLPSGAVSRVAAFTTVAGGKGLNVARVLARHGHRVVACGFAGGACGAALADLVAADGIEPAFTTTLAATRLGFVAVHPAGGSTALLEDGFAVAAKEIGALVQRVRSLLGGCALVVVSGSVPDPACSGLYRLLLDACALVGTPCWIDSYGPVMEEALAHARPPDLVKPNRQEYGRGGRKWVASPEAHITDGGSEIRVRHPQGRFRVTPPRIKERNAIGSGDCYLAALAHGRLLGWALTDQLRYAAAAGAANAARSDVARIAPADIAALVDGVGVEEVD